MAKSDEEKAAEQQRKAAENAAREGTDEARQSSEETLQEQGGMKPEPSQEDADRMKTGAYQVGEDSGQDQPDGPAARAAAEAAAANEEAQNRAAGASGAAPYKTRDSKSD